MSNAIFPVLPGVTWPIIKRPVWRTTTQQTVSGKELRTAMMTYPLWQFELPFDLLRQSSTYSEIQTLIGFYLQRLGSYDSFLYTDPSDMTVTAQGFGTGNGSTTAFQLVRTLGGFSEPIQSPYGGGALPGTAPLIYDNGVLVSAANYTISALGVVTFTVAPVTGHALTWTGSFYYRCRFMSDQYGFSQDMTNFWSLDKIDFVSIKQ